MPSYTPNPTFSDGNVLLASELNILASNAAFLYSLVSGTNVPFSGQTMTGSGDSRIWSFRHTNRYLHYKIFLDVGDSDELRIYVNGNVEYYDASNHSSDFTWESYIDTSTITSPPSVGSFYDVKINIVFSGSPSDLQIVYLVESDSTTL